MVKSNTKIAVALSGGVDSAVALAILNQSFNVHAFTMKLWDDSYPDSLKNSCFGYGKQEDIDTCKAICEHLNVPYTVIDLSKQFKEQVITPFKACYSSGTTPNPCVTCNKHIKFGLFIEEAKKHFDFSYFATGHYANIKEVDGEYYLKRVDNDKKDQTYFLWQLESNTLSKILFPLCNFESKDEVRRIAEYYKLPVASKKDSMSFADGKYCDLFNEASILEGDFTYKGTAIAKHKGIVHYTVGQRAKIPGMPEKLYIKKILPMEKEVVLDTLNNIVDNKISFSYWRESKLFRNPGEILFIKLKQEGQLIPISNIEIYPKVVVTIKGKVVSTPGQSCAIYNHAGYLVAGGII